jgi:hypothetical protein
MDTLAALAFGGEPALKVMRYYKLFMGNIIVVHA